MIVIVSRFEGVVEIGIFGLALALITPIAGLFGLGLRQGIATDIEKRFTNEEYISARILLIILMIFMLVSISSFLVNDKSTQVIVLLLMIPKIVDIFSETSYGIFQRENLIFVISRSLFLRALFGTTMFFLGYFFGGGLELAILGWGAAWSFVFLFFEAPRVRPLLKNHSTFSKFNSILKIIVIQTPLGFLALFGNLGVSIPRLALEPLVTQEELGYFTGPFLLLQAINAFFVTLTMTFLTPISKSLNTKTQRDVLAAVGMVLFSSVFAVILILITVYSKGLDLLLLVYGSTFVETSGLFFPLTVGWVAIYCANIFFILLLSMRAFPVVLGAEIIILVVLILFLYLAVHFSETHDGSKSIAFAFAATQWIRFALFGLVFVFFLFRINRNGNGRSHV